MIIKKITFIVAMLGMLASCSGNKKSEQQVELENTKTLVLYYSQTGTTKQVADEIRRQLAADIDSIVPEESYGYDYDATIERWRKEKEDSVESVYRTVTYKCQ